MECVQCHTPIPDDARFCHSCGSQVSDAEGQAAATAAMDAGAFAHMEKLLRDEVSGEFEIDRLLGRGGMAMVYLAHEVHLERQVAIKVLPPELTFGHGVERFKREAKTAAALDHPNIIPVYRVGSGGKIFWYAMKFLEGRSLDEILKEQQRFSLQETLQILRQVADALDYAHDHQVVHRDIKPANVMLDSRKRVVVTDFGIAKALTEGTLTASGSVIGTPYFMSPEQGMGKPVSGASDQYSVAVMAYRMLSGQVPFEGDSAIDILHKHCMMQPPALESVQPGLPQHVYRSIHKALAKDAGKRFPTVGAFVDGLERQTELTPDTDEMSELATVVVPAQMGAAASQPSGPVATEARTEMMQSGPPGTRTVATGGGKTGKLAAAAVILALGAGGTWFVLNQGGADAVPGQTEAAAESVPSGGQPAQPVPTSATVTLNDLPAGAVVTANGERQSGDAFDLEAGEYTLRVSAAGYEPFETDISVEAGVPMSVQYTGQRQQLAQRPSPRPAQTTPREALPQQPVGQPVARSVGALLLRVEPAALVTIDGVDRGEQSRLVDSLPAGQHRVRLERDGFIPVDTTITVVAGQGFRLVVRLQQRNE